MKLLDQLADIDDQIDAQSKKVTKAELEMERIAEELQDEFGITIDEADDHVAELQKKQRKLKKKILKTIDTVNEQFDLELSLED